MVRTRCIKCDRPGRRAPRLAIMSGKECLCHIYGPELCCDDHAKTLRAIDLTNDTITQWVKERFPAATDLKATVEWSA